MPVPGTDIFFAIGVAILMTQVCAAASHGLYCSSFLKSGFGAGNSVIGNGRDAI
jgi:hypothetical protein